MLRLCICKHRDVRQAQLAANEEEANRRLLAAAFAAKASRIKRIVDSITDKMQHPQPGPQFVRAIAEALDAGEAGITELKDEQHQQYNELLCEVSLPVISDVLRDAQADKTNPLCDLVHRCKDNRKHTVTIIL